MQNIQKKLAQLQIKGFTLLESLLTLFMTSLLLLAVSGSVRSSFEQVEQQIFFLEFEHFYRESQKLSSAAQSQLDMNFSRERISNGYNQFIARKGYLSDKKANNYVSIISRKWKI